MKLTVRDINTYNNLVKQGKAEKLGNESELLIPKLLENDEAVLYDLASGTTIRPGINLTEKILSTIDKYKNQE